MAAQPGIRRRQAGQKYNIMTRHAGAEMAHGAQGVLAGRGA